MIRLAAYSATSSCPPPPDSVARDPIFLHAYDEKRIPLDEPLREGVHEMIAYKFGCHADVRDVYWQVVEEESRKG